MKVWVLERSAAAYDNGDGLRGVYATPEAAATDAGVPLDQWTLGEDGYELEAHDLYITEQTVYDLDAVLAGKERERAEQATRKSERRARQWIK